MKQKKTFSNSKNHQTSWEPVQQWYRTIVGEEGHYYHQHVVLPGIKKILNFNQDTQGNLLDLACGNGVLVKHLPEKIHYHGIDISHSFINEAKERYSSKNRNFQVADITKPLPLSNIKFNYVTMVLCLQNLEHPDLAIKELSKHLAPNAKIVIVINHPCFRIPRQSSWGIDEERKIQYRRIDRYMSPLKIPIQAHPGKKNSATTFSFHHSLTTISNWLFEAGLGISFIEEWCSNKESTGKFAKMENRSREEFPLFMTIIANQLSL